MSILYTVTALLFAFFCVCTSSDLTSKLLLKLPCIIAAIVYAILAMKGFNLI